MEPKRPRSKTVILVAVIIIVLVAVASYYATALSNSDNRPKSVETESVLIR